MLLSRGTIRQGMTILPSAMINISFGFLYGWVAPAVKYLTSDKTPFNVSPDELSWIASALLAGEMSLAAVNGFVATKIGRKPMLMMAAFIQAVGLFFQVIAWSPLVLIFSRYLQGVAGGTWDVTWCIYLGEVTSPEERGVYGSLLTCLFMTGMMLASFLSLFVPFTYLSIIPFVISATAFLLQFLAKETPFYLIKKGEIDTAKNNLAWLRGKDDPEQVRAEFDKIKKYVEDEASNSRGILDIVRNPSQYKMVIIGVMLFVLNQPSGNIAIVSYQSMLLHSYDDPKSGTDLTVVYNVLQFIFINLCPLLIEKVGRKKPLVFGFVLGAIIHISLAVLLYLREHGENRIPYFSYIICILLNIYGIAFVVCIFPIVYVLRSELFPQEMKSLGNCLATVTNSLSAFAEVKLFLWIWSTFGVHANFVMYAIICIVGILYVLFLIPETKGKTLVEIQENIKMKSQKKMNSSALES